MLADYTIRVVVEESPPHFYREIQTDVINTSIVDPSFPSTAVRDACVEYSIPTVPTATSSGLNITTNVGTAIVNDVTAIVADVSNTKTCKVSVLRKTSDSSLEVWVFERTTGVYDSTPSGYTIEVDIIKEFQVVASGTTLTEV